MSQRKRKRPDAPTAEDLKFHEVIERAGAGAAAPAQDPMAVSGAQMRLPKLKPLRAPRMSTAPVSPVPILIFKTPQEEAKHLSEAFQMHWTAWADLHNHAEGLMETIDLKTPPSFDSDHYDPNPSIPLKKAAERMAVAFMKWVAREKASPERQVSLFHLFAPPLPKVDKLTGSSALYAFALANRLRACYVEAQSILPKDHPSLSEFALNPTHLEKLVELTYKTADPPYSPCFDEEEE